MLTFIFSWKLQCSSFQPLCCSSALGTERSRKSNKFWGQDACSELKLEVYSSFQESSPFCLFPFSCGCCSVRLKYLKFHCVANGGQTLLQTLWSEREFRWAYIQCKLQQKLTGSCKLFMANQLKRKPTKPRKTHKIWNLQANSLAFQWIKEL